MSKLVEHSGQHRNSGNSELQLASRLQLRHGSFRASREIRKAAASAHLPRGARKLRSDSGSGPSCEASTGVRTLGAVAARARWWP